jgi:YHS domain-containing protein
MKLLFYTFVTILFFASVVAYFLDILPISFGLHSKIYKSSSVAIDGYDIVNYFNKKDANKGDITFNYKLDNNNWFFISAANLKTFKANHAKYIPQFGGYCAYYISKGYTYPPDPNIWHIDKGKLYFFSDEEKKNQALADWENVLSDASLNWKN